MSSVGITPVVRGGQRPGGIVWASWFEPLLACAVVAAWFPFFDRVGGDTFGRDARFAERAPIVATLPAPVLGRVCSERGSAATPALRQRLCASAAGADATDMAAMPSALAAAGAAARAALAAVDAAGMPTLQCAHALASRRSGDDPGSRASFANALLIYAAALDGERAAGTLAREFALPDAKRVAPRSCGALTAPDALARTASLVAAARQSSLFAAKNEAMRELLRTAGWQWAGAMLLGLAFVTAGRRLTSPALGISLALASWAAAAYAARVPWPLAGEQSFVPARASLELPAAPAPFVLGLLALAAGVLCIALVLPRPRPGRPQAAASRIGYPGFVLATGVGFLILLDLSANASHGNRYLALYHQGHLWLAMLTLSVLVFLRQPIGRGLAWSLAIVDGVASGVGRRLGAGGTLALLLLLAALLCGAFGALLASKRQLTSEIGRIWLMLGAAWFFYMRGTPLAERLARSGTSFGSLARYVLPLAFVAIVLVGAMVVTRDMGPLLIAGYAAGAFLAASIAMWAHRRFGVTTSAHALAVVLFVAWIVAITHALFQLGAIDDVTAGRLENLAAPLASTNDQLALVTWFQRVAPPAGFGLGAVPWCGYGGSAGCPGVPAQIQSDYTFTAVVGAFGWTAAWALTVGCAVWLHRLVRHHGRVTRGEPRLVASAGRMANDEQGLLSWIAVAWVVLTLCQLAVTVAGNLAVIPLTGVTFPFVSFGMTSLVVNAALLALCLSVNVPERP